MNKFRRGLTLIELSIALVFAFIMILGTLSLTYHSSLDTNKSEAANTAGRIGNMLLEGWEISGGSPYFDPVEKFSSIINIRQLEDNETIDVTALPNLHGRYEIDINNTIYRVIFSWRKDADSRVKTLNITIAWSHKRVEWQPESGIETTNLTGYVESN
ncbi:MAG: hypothetical protein JW804_03275 [Sedimentisphaerales bacterium]|nr:hypothetical protein [Sedimentisphaerales bacterium]